MFTYYAVVLLYQNLPSILVFVSCSCSFFYPRLWFFHFPNKCWILVSINIPFLQSWSCLIICCAVLEFSPLRLLCALLLCFHWITTGKKWSTSLSLLSRWKCLPLRMLNQVLDGTVASFFFCLFFAFEYSLQGCTYTVLRAKCMYPIFPTILIISLGTFDKALVGRVS